MKAELIDGVIVFTLSRRNVLALLAKVDDPTSARTLISPDDSPIPFSLKVDPDAVHYADRAPGTMVARTEAFIAAHPSKGGVCLTPVLFVAPTVAAVRTVSPTQPVHVVA